MKRAAQTLRRSTLSLICAGAALFAANPATAACDVRGMSTSTATFEYDPFSQNTFQVQNVTLHLERLNTGNGEFTKYIGFYLKGASAATDGAVVIPTLATGGPNVTGLNQDIFYDFSQAAPILPVDKNSLIAANGWMFIDFTGGSGNSDSVDVQFTVQLPSNLDITASQTLSFDIHYACLSSGKAGKDEGTTGVQTNAMTFPIEVLSALQATYAGTALAFNEIGNVTNTDVAGDAYITPTTNYVRVQSSGPYQITMSSQNGYYMTFNDALGTQARINYKLYFLGQTRSPGNVSLIDKQCMRAGIGTAVEDHLIVRAALLEGGQGKMVAPNYSDLLTVTISPLADPLGTNFGENCPGLTPP